jgi:branched-chain amino acid transport system substrate-binding protein
MTPFIRWVKSLPPSERPKTAAYPSADDPFATPAVATAQLQLEQAGIRTVYSNKTIPEKVSAYKLPAAAVAQSGAQVVVLGSTDVPTVQTFMQVFEQQRYTPHIFIAVAGPDQGQAFIGPVGKANADGMMVPGGWYGDYSNPLSHAMVEDYIAKYGGTATGVNADVAEAYSVGEVAAAAIKATGGTDNGKIMRYLHSKVTIDTVQGPAQFNALGENPGAAKFISQWQSGRFVQVLPQGVAGSTKIIFKAPWGQ